MPTKAQGRMSNSSSPSGTWLSQSGQCGQRELMLLVEVVLALRNPTKTKSPQIEITIIPESRMRENRPSGSEGGAAQVAPTPIGKPRKRATTTRETTRASGAPWERQAPAWPEPQRVSRALGRALVQTLTASGRASQARLEPGVPGKPRKRATTARETTRVAPTIERVLFFVRGLGAVPN